MILSSGIRRISAGQVGVALLFGKVRPVVLQEGINLVNPLYDVVEMNTRVLRHQAKYDVASKDLQAVHVEMVLNYRLLPDKAYEKAIEAKQIEEQKGEGEGEATYNQKVSASLTPTLIQQRYLEKWDGKLPQFSMGSGGNAPGLMLNMPMPAPAKP